ncbi:TatD family hydrolase [Acetivibrio clariflavus]|uniref:Hydrolase, TatD family n=1 Tax=Acetivibrio clariflavus (strain DSM 19732 / NBRC 101661 / EBR45) TaxID=720554 RepID=G8LSU2_ACECE|nr:TatD family hydrolase [Acetivibrio clariflavus]AEV70455.1 hydrolase, TatD family [Acetivibrio clariflavus DSM 19732]
MLFDTHAHYDDDKFAEDRYEVIEKAHESGVSYIINAATDVKSCEDSLAFAHRYEYVYAAVGIHPHEVGDADDNALDKIAQLAKDSKVVAIGEIGLDYYYDFAPRELQKHWFAQQINLAKELKLPVIVHDREAHQDSLEIIKQQKANEVGGVFHCYSGSLEMAKELLNNNFYISVGGSLTFKNAKKLVEVVRWIPLDKLLIETDCPYLTPEPHRGKRNDSSYVRFVAEKVAEIKQISFETVADVTLNNAKKLFNI